MIASVCYALSGENVECNGPGRLRAWKGVCCAQRYWHMPMPCHCRPAQQQMECRHANFWYDVQAGGYFGQAAAFMAYCRLLLPEHCSHML